MLDRGTGLNKDTVIRAVRSLEEQGMIRKTARPSSSRQVRARPLSLQSIRRAAKWHRRKLAVVAAVAAVLTGINAALPPDPPTVPPGPAR